MKRILVSWSLVALGALGNAQGFIQVRKYDFSTTVQGSGLTPNQTYTLYKQTPLGPVAVGLLSTDSAGQLNDAAPNQLSGAASIQPGDEVFVGIDSMGTPTRRSASAITQNRYTTKWLGNVIKGGLYILHLSSAMETGLKPLGFEGDVFAASPSPHPGVTATWNTVAYNPATDVLDLDVTLEFDTSLFSIGDTISFASTFNALGSFLTATNLDAGELFPPDALTALGAEVGGGEFQVVPEPATLAGLGLALGALGRRRTPRSKG